MTYIANPQPLDHTGFLLAEEASLKKYLSGIQLPDGPISTNEDGDRVVQSRAVPVRFRWPESEVRISYPYIMIDLLDIVPDYQRWESVWNVADCPSEFVDPNRGAEDGGPVRVGQYFPSENPDIMPNLLDPDAESGYFVENYKAYRLVFQVAHVSRNPFHDRFLTARFMTDIFPPRPFWIGVDADHTWRRAELLSWVPADTMETTEAAKRIFRKIYTVSLEAEIPVGTVTEVLKARKLHVDLYDKDSDAREAVEHDADGEHEIALQSYNVEPPSGT